MTLDEWLKLTPDEQSKRSPTLSGYTGDWDFLKQIEAEFKRQFGAQPGIAKVFCGDLGTVGPITGIRVTIRRGQPRTKLPKHFHGFLVEREYERNA